MRGLILKKPLIQLGIPFETYLIGHTIPILDNALGKKPMYLKHPVVIMFTPIRTGF
jgi:hypothetical protein